MNKGASKTLGKNDFTIMFIICIIAIGFVAASGTDVINLRDWVKVQVVSPLESNGAIPVNIQDQHTEIVDLKLSRVLDNITLLQNYSINDVIINISTTGIIPTIDMTLCLKEGSAFYQARPVLITPLGGNNYSLKMDTPLDFAFTISGGCALTSTNLAVDGSVTPIIFRITPGGLNEDIEWDITRFILLWGGDGIGAQNDAPDDGDFGVTTALTNGIVIRVVDGITKNIFNAKTNGDFRVRTYDLTYQGITRGGVYTVTTRRTFAGQDKNGVTIRLKANSKDEFQIIIQDDLTAMTGGQMVAQGHIVQN